MVFGYLSLLRVLIIPLSFSSIHLLLSCCLSISLSFFILPFAACSLSAPPLYLPLSSFSLPHSRFVSVPRRSLSLVFSSRKSLSTICLAVMNSKLSEQISLGQINETLQEDKLCVSASVYVRESVCT